MSPSELSGIPVKRMILAYRFVIPNMNAIRNVQELGVVLKGARVRRGLTQMKVCRDLRIGRTLLNEIESGQAVGLGFNRLLSLLSYYGLSFRIGPKSGRPTLFDLDEENSASEQDAVR